MVISLQCIWSSFFRVAIFSVHPLGSQLQCTVYQYSKICGCNIDHSRITSLIITSLIGVRGGPYTRKLTTRARKAAKYGTRFSVDRRRRGQGREEWCDLIFKKLLFAINFLRFGAHLSRALSGGRF